mgnify:CR=1 FL=1
MNSKDIKARILKLADSDPDGFGFLRQELGKTEWGRCASHAAGFLSSWFYDQLDERFTVEECVEAAHMANNRNERVSDMLQEVRQRRKATKK